MKRALIVGLSVVLGLLLVLVLRTLALSPPDRVPAAQLPALDGAQSAAALSRLSTALQFKTLPDHADDFSAFHTFLRQSFPLVHRRLSLEKFGHSLLYHWPGGEQCAPLLLTAHQDIVPVEAPQAWQHPPFDGVIENGYIWGRGSMDDKGSLMAILESAEAMLAKGDAPPCDVWLAFGHDEETGGTHGAAVMAAELLSKGLRFAMVLDEGGMVLPGETLGVDGRVALIGIAEKGYLSVTLEAHGAAGHSSRPPNNSAVSVLAHALVALQDSPRPAALSGPTRLMLEQVAPYQSFVRRLVFANLWMFEPVVIHQLAAKPDTHALLRTTMAPTMLNAGVKDNVLPATARAVINFRLAPGETRESLMLWLEQTLPVGVEASIFDGFFAEPSAISPTDSPAYRQLSALAEGLPSEPLPVPFLLIAGTDARHYQALSDSVYRFLPMSLSREDVARFHGANERLAVAQYQAMMRFYAGVLASRFDPSEAP
ncbi:MAG: M20/M25/M40 family metallo-hydrolase [Alcanivorax nanhaiticus]